MNFDALRAGESVELPTRVITLRDASAARLAGDERFPLDLDESRAAAGSR